MLDYKDIITKHYALRMSGREIAAALGVSKSGVNGFLSAFDKCDTLHYPFRQGSPTMGSLNWSTGEACQWKHGISVSNCRTMRRWRSS